MYISGRGDEDKSASAREIQRGEAAAEAGPGAMNEDELSMNKSGEAIEASSNASQGSIVPEAAVAENERPKLERKDSTLLEERGRGRIALIMFALGMAVFLAALDVTIITTALPTISEHFHSSAGYTWVR